MGWKGGQRSKAAGAERTNGGALLGNPRWTRRTGETDGNHAAVGGSETGEALSDQTRIGYTATGGAEMLSAYRVHFPHLFLAWGGPPSCAPFFGCIRNI